MITFSKLGKHGRLGNQLWQIASTIGIAHKNNTGFMFSDWEYSRYFKNQLPYGVVDGPIKVYNEMNENYHDVNLNMKYNWDLFGYFQSWKYFNDYVDEIKYYFELPDVEEFDAVAIHVRRGDYLDFQNVFPILGLDYYRSAMNYFRDEQMFFVFSDDMHWCQRYFKDKMFSNKNIVFDVASPTIVSFTTMVSCKHHIIANSSFSWWGAYLSSNPEKIVVAPKKWINDKNDKIEDRVLPEWITL